MDTLNHEPKIYPVTHEFISYCYTKLYGDDGQRRVDQLKQTMQQLFEGYRGSCVTSVDQDTPNKTSGGSGELEMLICSVIMVHF